MVKAFTKSQILPVYAPISGLAYNVPPTMLKAQYCAACKNMRFNSKEVLTRLGYTTFKSSTARDAAPLKVYMYRFRGTARMMLLATEDGVYWLDGLDWTKIAESLAVLSPKIVDFTSAEACAIYVNGRLTPKKLDSDVVWSNILGTQNYHPEFVNYLGERLILFGGQEDTPVTIEDCEDAWDELVDGAVTSTLDTDDYQWGSGSAKLVVGAGIGDGDILATEVIAADLTTPNFVRLCIKSSVDVASGDLHLLLDDSVNCGSPQATLNIGALKAGDWTEKILANGGHAAQTALISVGLKYTANAQACTIHIDAIRGVSLTPTYNRIRYSIAGDMTDWSGTGSGAFSFNKGTGKQIMMVAPLGDGIAVYKDYSLGLLRYIGGKSIFRIDVLVDAPTMIFQRAFTVMEGTHYFLGYDNIYSWRGETKFTPIGDRIKDHIFPLSTSIYDADYCFMASCPLHGELFLFLRREDDTGSDVFIYNVKTKAWSQSFAPIITSGDSVIDDYVEYLLLGTAVSKKTFTYDYNSKNDDTTTIDSNFETSDFVISENEYLINKKRFMGVHLEAKGNTADDTITMEYSTDGGVSWSAADEKTLTAVYAMYVWHFQTTTRRIRFRFANAKADEGFTFRFYGVEHIERERSG